MYPKHDKSIVSSANFLKKFSTIVDKKISPIRIKAHEEVEKQLKNDSTFFDTMPFIWISGMEYYGDFEAIKIEKCRVNKKYKSVEVDVVVPISELNSLKEKTDEEIAEFYKNIFNLMIEAVHEKYGNKELK